MEKKKIYTITIPYKLHRAFRASCYAHDLTMMKGAAEALTREIERQKSLPVRGDADEPEVEPVASSVVALALEQSIEQHVERAKKAVDAREFESAFYAEEP